MKCLVVILFIGAIEINGQFNKKPQTVQLLDKLIPPSPENFNISSLKEDEELEFAPGIVVKRGPNGPVYKVTQNDTFRDSVAPIITAPIAAADISCAAAPTPVGLFCFDCKTLMFCNNADTPLFTTTCPAKTPYCDGAGSCTDVMPDRADCHPFTCTSAGYFPDPGRCNIFYYCEANNPDPIETRVCPTNYVYNTRTRNCERKSTTLCKPIDCRNRGGNFALYPPNNGYYAFCMAQGENTYSVIMFKCVDADNMVFRLDTLRCEFNCRREGYFADPTDVTRYYFCYRQNGVWRTTRDTCPTGLTFTDGRCQ